MSVEAPARVIAGKRFEGATRRTSFSSLSRDELHYPFYPTISISKSCAGAEGSIAQVWCQRCRGFHEHPPLSNGLCP